METQSEIKFISISEIQKGHWYTWGSTSVYIKAIENGDNLKYKSHLSLFTTSKMIDVPHSYQILYHKSAKQYKQKHPNDYVYFEIPDKLKVLLL